MPHGSDGAQHSRTSDGRSDCRQPQRGWGRERGGHEWRGAARHRWRKALCRQQWGAEPAAAPAAVGSRTQSRTPPPRSGGGWVFSVLGLQVILAVLGRVRCRFSSGLGRVRCRFSSGLGRARCRFSSGLGRVRFRFSSVLGRVRCRFSSVLGRVRCRFSSGLGRARI